MTDTSTIIQIAETRLPPVNEYHGYCYIVEVRIPHAPQLVLNIDTLPPWNTCSIQETSMLVEFGKWRDKNGISWKYKSMKQK